MGFILCLSTCSLVFILGLAAGQESATDEPIILDDHLGMRQFPETTTEKPIILDDHPGKRQFPAKDPPMFTPPSNADAVPIPMKEDLGGFENVNPTHVNGEELFESDILLSPEQRRQFLERKAIPSLSSRWPNGPNGTPVVPYQFGDTAVSTTAVEAGLAHWKEHTCIDFQLITGTPPSSYLNFIKGSGCWSYVGMQPSPQDLSIGTGCSSLGTVCSRGGPRHGISPRTVTFRQGWLRDHHSRKRTTRQGGKLPEKC
ncbi:zinc metalloproteinase nas-34-like [Macrobrachium rosenbergii]|uniref:zinc metalloproteinase nas-34-like n=1 Tax=Macrobrachium rosenbergii TaxID=79674 RepID=UPI0034D43B8D